MEDQTGGSGLRDKATTAKDKAMGTKDTVMEKGKSGFSTVKDKVMTAKEAVSAFTDEAKKQDLQGSTKEAIHKVGEVSRDVGQTAKEEVRHTKESASGSSTTDTSSPY